MDVIADILLIAGAIGAGVYCFVLARRLRRFTDLEKGVGGAIAVLSVQVDDMTKAIGAAQTAAAATSGTLDALTARAEEAARRLELLVASMHDLPIDGAKGGSMPPPRPERTAPQEAGRGTVSAEPATLAPRPSFFLSQRARIRDRG